MIAALCENADWLVGIAAGAVAMVIVWRDWWRDFKSRRDWDRGRW